MRGLQAPRSTPATVDIFRVLKDARKVLIIPNDRVGGLFIGAPVYKIVRQFYPQACIKMLIDASRISIARQLPFIDDIVTARLDQPIWRPEVREVKERLVAEKFDLIFCLGFDCSFRLAYLCQHSQARLRVGFKRLGMSPFNLEVRSSDPPCYEGEQCLKMLDTLGIQGDGALHWALAREHTRQIQARYLDDTVLPAQKIAVDLSPAEGQRLSDRQIDELVGRVVERGGRALLFFSLADTKLADSLKNTYGNRILLFIQQELTSAAPLLQGCQALIAANTELFHLGISLQIPTVGLFDQDHRRWMPPDLSFVRVVHVPSLQQLDSGQVVVALEELLSAHRFNTVRSAAD